MNNIRKWIYRMKPPCSKCPYEMGIIKTLVHPCPECKLNDYRKFEQFQKQMRKDKSDL